MQVTGKDIRYTLYIEGVLVPISSLAVRIPSGNTASLSVDILPIPEGLMILKGMRAHLFKKVNTEEPKLKFNGMVTNKVYVKAGAHRALRLEISTIDARWDTMTMVEFTERQMTSGATSSKASIEAQERLAQGNLTKEEEALYRAIAAQQDNAMPMSMGAFLAGNPLYEAAIGSGNTLSNKPSLSPEICSEILKGATPVSAPPITSLVGVFERNIHAAKGNVVSGLIATLKSAYKRSNQYNQMEMVWNRIEEALYAMPCLEGSSFVTEYNSTPDVPGASMSSAVSALVKSIVADTRSGVPVRHVLTQIMDALFFKISTDPTQIHKSVCFHPLTVGYIPPKCNVIFPNMYDTLSLNFNSWSEPTRSIIGFSPFVEGNGQVQAADSRMVSTMNLTLAPSIDPHIAAAWDLFMYKHNKDLSDVGNIQAEQKEKALSIGMLSREETMVGVTANIVTLSSPMLSSMKMPDATIMADFIHSLAKFSVRMCAVRGELLDDLVVGMPLLIMDSDFTVHGTLEDVSYNVDENGSVSTNITVGYPKMIMNEDALPTPPLWLNSKDTSDTEITKTYHSMFGCGSIYEGITGIDLKSYNQMATLRAVVKELHRQYNSEVNKRVFVEKYRARPQLGLYDVFKKIYGAIPVKRKKNADDSEVTDVLFWEGKEFGEYSGIGNPAGIKPEHPPVNKQERVKVYINAYGQRKGIVAE
jgi:hypothetical protein